MQKQKKQYIAINTHLFLALALFLVFLTISICCAIEHNIGLSIAFAIATLLPLFVFFISPLCFIFSDENIKFIYTLGQKETIAWSAVRSISLKGHWFGGVGLPHYCIAYPTNEKHLFFVCGEISKTRKTKKMIEKYYKKNIL